jgi:hypothetical protein
MDNLSLYETTVAGNRMPSKASLGEAWQLYSSPSRVIRPSTPDDSLDHCCVAQALVTPTCPLAEKPPVGKS